MRTESDEFRMNSATNSEELATATPAEALRIAADMPSEKEFEMNAEQEKVEPGQRSDTSEVTIKATPTARKRAKELGVVLSEVVGTGSGGQVTADDVEKKAQTKS
jgi:pyruvate/2-oxoglutarate dehydrogenase complex dihydrolipoamide acyltransferase (E2) component